MTSIATETPGAPVPYLVNTGAVLSPGRVSVPFAVVCVW